MAVRREVIEHLTDDLDGSEAAESVRFALDGRSYVIDLNKKRVTSWKHIPGVQPTMTADEQIECEQAVLASPEFLLNH